MTRELCGCYLDRDGRCVQPCAECKTGDTVSVTVDIDARKATDPTAIREATSYLVGDVGPEIFMTRSRRTWWQRLLAWLPN